MNRRDRLRLVQVEYERLRRANPSMTHKMLWVLAEDAVSKAVATASTVPPGPAAPPEPTVPKERVAGSPGEQASLRANRAALRLIGQFLHKASERGLITEESFWALRAFAEQIYPVTEAQLSLEKPGRVEPTPRTPAPPPRPAAAAARPRPPSPPTPTAPPPESRRTVPTSESPSRTSDALTASTAIAAARRRTADLWELIGPDISVHGFSYLGLLLTFVGVFGFMFFSFEELPNSVQPFVEILIPIILFGWAYFLRRRHAIVVAHLMGFLAGLLLPVVVYASIVDGAPVPPDLVGSGLIVGLTVVSLLIAAAYAWWVAGHRDSWLRFLVAPMVWVAALAPGFFFKMDEALAGDAITRFVSAQPALSAAAIALTLLLVARRPQHWLTAPTFAAAVPAVPIAYLLTVALAAGEGWHHAAPLIVAGVASLVSVELLARRYGYTSEIALARSLLLAVALAPLLPLWGVGWTGLIVVVAYLGMIEHGLREGVDTGALTLAAAGVLSGLAMSSTEPWLMVTAWSLVTLSSHLRRHTLTSAEQRFAATTTAAVAPLGIAAGLIMALPDGPAIVFIGALIAAVAVGVRWSHTPDAFWGNWLTAAGAILAGGSVLWYFGNGSGSPWAAACATLLAGFTLAVSPVWPELRVWLASAAIVGAVAIGFDSAAVTDRAAWWAVIGLAAIVAAAAWRQPVAVHLAVIGHLVGLAALFGGGSPEARAVVLGTWSLGWLLEVVADACGWSETRRPAELALLRAVLPEASEVTLETGRSVVLAFSIPFAVVAVANVWDAFATEATWTGALLAAVAVGYGIVARWQHDRRALSTVFAVGSVALSIAGIVAAAPEPWPSIIAAVGSIAVAWVVARPRRWTWYVWFGWAMSGVLAVLIAERAGVQDRDLNLVLLGWGTVLLVGGLVVDGARAGRRRPGEWVRIPWVRAPVVLGAFAVPIGLAPVYAREPSVFGWWSLAAAAVYGSVAFLLRAGIITAPAYALATVGVAALSPRPVLEDPWILVPVAATLVAASWMSERAQPADLLWYLRWDLPPFVVAHGVALFALARAGMIDSTATFLGIGALSVMVGVWKRHRGWGDVGNLLVVVAAATTGPGWVVLALAATALRGVISAHFTSGVQRWSHHALGVGASAAAWIELTVWQGWSTPEIVSYSAIAFGALGLVVGGMLGLRDLGWDWVVAWGGLATAGSAAAVALGIPDNVDQVFPAIGAALFAAGAALGTRTRREAVLKFLTVAALGALWLELGLWQRWGAPEAVSYTSMVFGALAAVVGGWLIVREFDRDWIIAWAALAAVGWGASVGLAPGQVSTVVPALGSALFALGVGLAARRLPHPVVQAAAVSATGVAWIELVAGLGWSVEAAVSHTSLAAGAIALVVAPALRLGRLSPSWTIAWGALGVAAITVAWFAALAQRPVAIVGVAPAIGLVALAAAMQLAARPLLLPLHVAAVAYAAWAWIALVIQAGWSARTATATTAAVFGVLGVLVVEVARSPWRTAAGGEADDHAVEATRYWMGLAALGVSAATASAVVTVGAPVWWAVSSGLALLAVALARGAAPLAWQPARPLSMALGVAAVAGFGEALDIPFRSMAGVMIVLGVTATAGALWLTRRRSGSPWRVPAGVLGAVATAAALIYAAQVLPDRGPIIVVAVGAAVQLVAAGAILKEPVLVSLGPPLLLASWIGVATEAVSGTALWFTVPIAVTLLAEVDVLRWSRRRADQPADTSELQALEYAGIGLLGVVGLVEMFETSVVYALVGFALAAGLFLWAVATRVRRRTVAAGVLATVTAVLAIFAAAAGQAPPSAFFWIAAAGTGFAVMLAMALVEAYRSKTGTVMRRLDQLMEGWD